MSTTVTLIKLTILVRFTINLLAGKADHLYVVLATNLLLVNRAKWPAEAECRLPKPLPKSRAMITQVTRL